MASIRKSIDPAPLAGALAEAADRALHHAFGPSRWPALMDCPRWEGRPAGDDAKRGTDFHSIFEAVLKCQTVEPNDGLEAHVVNAAKRLLEQIGAPEKLYVEERLEIPAPDGSETGIFGRVDLAWISKAGAMHVCDLKTAENPERDYTPQLLAYAYGFIARHRAPKELHLHFVYADTGRITDENVPVAESWTRYSKVYDRIVEIMEKRGQCEPKQCGWCQLCSHFAECRAPRTVAETVRDTLADAPEHWVEYSPARKAQLCAVAETVMKWGTVIKDRAAEDAKAGLPVEDPANGIFYGLQERRGALDTNVDAAWEVAKANGITKEQFRGCLKVDLPKLKSALSAWMKAKDAAVLLETCGTRKPATLAFVRKGVK